MIRLTDDQLARWRAEIDLGVEFREKEFGTYRQQAVGSPPTTTLAGRNLDYFEQGGRTDEYEPPLNLIFPIVKTIVPTLFYQNPRAVAIPQSRQEGAGEDAFYASELINQDLRNPDFRFKESSQLTVFDSYVLGFGVVKVGYATEFGPDILPTKQEDRKRFRERIRDQLKTAQHQMLERMGLKQPEPKESEPEQVQADTAIRSERTYLQWISPFDFVVDPRARDLNDARWVAQRIRRTLAEVKGDRRYGQAKQELEAEAIDDDRILESFIEDFQTVDVWEVHYKDPDSPTGITVLTFAATQTQTKALMHDHSTYDLGGWQYEWLVLNKHGHRLYPISTISVARPLLDRINSAFDALLEQIDKFFAKVAYDKGKVSDQASKDALTSNTIGANVGVDGDPRTAITVIAMQQLNADMVNFLNYVVDFIILITGLTRAQLTGLTTAQTATEAQIGQSGQNLRRTDEGQVVAGWTNRVVAKLWRVKSQFQDLTEIDLAHESSELNPTSGISATQWYPPIDEARAERLKSNRFEFHIEVSSIQKPNLDIIRAQYQEFVKALMEPIVTRGLALEGKRLSASEVIRQWAKFFEEYGLTGGINKLIVPVSNPQLQQALMQFGQKPTDNGQQSLAGSVPNTADLLSRNFGEKGQGASPV